MTTGRTLKRSVNLLRAFRHEQTDPDRFYGLMAADTVSLLGRRLELEGSRALDVGGGAGYLTKALREAGAACFLVEADIDELSWRGARPAGAVLGDGYRLPFRPGSADLVVSSNVLEHVARPYEMIDELIGAARPGGHVWLSFTNWYGPWGGHETSPWHLLGGESASRRFERGSGHGPKNRFGCNLFPIHVGPTLRYVRSHAEVDLIQALPRYHPWFARRIIDLPGLRELLTWNLELLLQKRPGRGWKRGTA